MNAKMQQYPSKILQIVNSMKFLFLYASICPGHTKTLHIRTLCIQLWFLNQIASSSVIHINRPQMVKFLAF